MKELAIKTPDPQNPCTTLSGGNQQRIVLAKWLACKPDVLILNGPTVGVDIGSKHDIHAILQRLANQGMAVIIISDDLLAEKLFGLKKTASSANDCYMRPGSYWTWVDAKGNVKTITGTTLKPVWSSYNTTVAAVEKIYKSYNSDKYTVTYYLNGKQATWSADVGSAGKGSLVEIYEIPAATGKSELRIVEIETYIDYITEVYTYHKTVTLG